MAVGSRLNWLRAAVLGANDGIVSVAGLVVGVAGATNSRPVIFTAGLAGLVAGAISMSSGEYVSVSSQRDAEEAIGTKPNDLTNPWQAAFASALAFLAGAAIPLVAILMPPPEFRVPVTFISVLFALAITGSLSAKAGNANVPRATLRVMAGGAIAMIITYMVGNLFGVAV